MTAMLLTMSTASLLKIVVQTKPLINESLKRDSKLLKES